MEPESPQAALERLVRETGADYAGLSRLLGRNAAYIQQFVKRGVPRKLDEEDRKILAEFFGVDERVLGAPAGTRTRSEGAQRLISVARLDVGASAGHGADPGDEAIVSHIGFDGRWLRQLCSGREADLSLIQVEGDSMSPTLADGDDILVDRSDAGEHVRDGIYVLKRDDALLVKRIALSPSAGTISITSDNDAYPSWQECETSEINILGRVVWFGRKVR